MSIDILENNFSLMDLFYFYGALRDIVDYGDFVVDISQLYS